MIELNDFYIGESVQFMKENIPDNFVDLTITSPPYDDLRKYKGFIFDYKSMFNELYRITKVGGVVVWIVCDKTEKGSETLTSFKHALYAKEIGFNVHDTMIYAKNNTMPMFYNSKRYNHTFEYMFIFSKNKIPNTFNAKLVPKVENYTTGKGQITRKTTGKEETKREIKRSDNPLKLANNIWFYNTGNNQSSKDKIAFEHPAIFPEQLALDHILSWSNESDIILDPMCGSGTTCKQAFLHNRKFIGIDMSKEYINDICIPRLKEYGWKSNLDIAN